MQPAAGVDGRVGHADFLDLFEVEEPFAIEQGVQRHDPQRRLIFVLITLRRDGLYVPLSLRERAGVRGSIRHTPCAVFNRHRDCAGYILVNLDRCEFLGRQSQDINRTGIYGSSLRLSGGCADLIPP